LVVVVLAGHTDAGILQAGRFVESHRAVDGDRGHVVFFFLNCLLSFHHWFEALGGVLSSPARRPRPSNRLPRSGWMPKRWRETSHQRAPVRSRPAHRRAQTKNNINQEVLLGQTHALFYYNVVTPQLSVSNTPSGSFGQGSLVLPPPAHEDVLHLRPRCRRPPRPAPPCRPRPHRSPHRRSILRLCRRGTGRHPDRAGLQVIMHSLSMIGVFVERVS
jgi:hypothetical protein